MNWSTELRAFRLVIAALVAAIALLIGSIAGFGGLDAMAALVGARTPGDVDPALRNHLRAFSVVFAGFGLLIGWTALALEERKTGFRIAVAVIVAAGLARVTGWIVDGAPGALATLFLTMELVLFPLLLAWHARLLRLAREHRGTA